MNIHSILNQVLGAGQQLTQQRSDNNLSGGLGNLLGGTGLGNLGNMLNDTENSLGRFLGNTENLKKLGTGAAAAGVLSMLLGGNGSRSLSGSIAKMGSLAAIGTLAYKAYQNWAQNHPQHAAVPSQNLIPSAERSADEIEQSSRVVLKAMVAAAKADGELSAAEQAAIIEQVGQEDAEVQAWLNQLLENPPSVEQIAQEVGNDDALAAEVYLASRIVCGELDRKEIAYLVNLQQALGLSDALVEQLEKQAGF